MPGRGLTLVVILSLVVAGFVSVASATPPRPGTEGNGLSENESATLWSRDNDSRYITNAEYRRAYGERRTAIQQAANGTDLTFRRPPATAGIWTRNDLVDYTPGNASVSVFPPSANRTNSTLIRDAHATIFAVTPSTVAHTEPGTTTHYFAPRGTVLGTVDYRVAVPDSTMSRSVRRGEVQIGNETGNRTTVVPGNQTLIRTTRRVSWSLQNHEIEEIRLERDGEVVARTNGSHRPRIPYELADGRATLTLEADIEVRLVRNATVTRFTNRSSQNETTRGVRKQRHNATVVTDAVTVSDSVAGRVYGLDPSLQYARYPDGDLGVAAFQQVPWQGYRLVGEREVRVRGVWRFYTARDTGWEMLVRSNATGVTRNRSDALPVVVHAYPSRIGPRIEPAGRGPELLARWGRPKASPGGTLGENVSVEVVTDAYEPSYGLAARYDGNASTPITVHGIVHGVNRTLRPAAAGRERTIRRSNLTVERLRANDSGLTLRITLRDAATGEPIGLTASDRLWYGDLFVEEESAYLTVGDRRVRTNLSGTTTVRIEESGVYTVRYHPSTWLTHDPSYTSTATTVRWHPLTTVSAWIAFGVQLLQWFLPFAVALFAGRRLGGLFRYRGDL
ncbi:hypothetical protein [Haloglomus litoreum]|uniref:hypothetical protein n=1 Tax=Haloglomus litoreum TaxID=3034026 RepID=UPI0023E8A861|nr:hypothetical protein [Haloglomus sp. DT116]